MSALRSDHAPLYAKAGDAIEQFIAERGLQPGEKLPPEASLAEILGVSRSTIREGLRHLELQRRINRIHGRGTIIAPAIPAVSGLATLESLESMAARQGWQCGTSGKEVETVRLPAFAAEALGLSEKERATRVVLVRTHDGQPLWLAESWVPHSIMPIEEIQSRLRGTVFDLFGADLAPADYASSTLSATAATTVEAELLQIPRRAPLVVLTEVFYQAPERALFYSRNLLIPGKIILSITRTATTDRSGSPRGDASHLD
jgi:DNA-binding GntR family transcriptional regulator